MNLVTRIITALVLIGMCAAILKWLPTWGFIYFIEFFMLIGLLEWCRLGKMNEIKQSITFAIFIAITLPFIMGFIGFALTSVSRLRLYEAFFLGITAILWLSLIPWVLYKKINILKGWMGMVMGAWILAVTVIAVSNLINRSAFALFAGLSIPIIADTFAYAGGKLIGKTPFTIISPKKTKEGVVVGLIAVTFFGGFILKLSFGLHYGFAFPIALICGVAAVIGDLLESMAKRYAQVKDSGTILPGHGGILDRFDSHFASLTVLTALLWVVG